MPQGSILGPLLYLIYMNDIQNCSDFFKYILYADDTTLFNPLNNYSNSNDDELINNEINKVQNWLCANKLSLNIKKTKFMIFHTNQRKLEDKIPKIQINNVPIEHVKEFNFLGITLDENLTWNCHINKIAMKLSKYIGILNKLKHYLPSYILKTLYDSLILSQLNYGILAWGHNLNRILKLQKKAIRTITNSKYNSHTDPLFHALNTLKITDIFKLNVLKFYYKHEQNLLPCYLQSLDFSTIENIHHHNTRNKTAIVTYKTNLNLTRNTIKHTVPKIVNGTESNIKAKIHTHSLQGFAWYIKQNFIKNYQVNCKLENCYICNSY